MNPSIKTPIIKKWLENLRSGKFEQGKGALLRGGRYCCLGVLCETAIESGICITKDDGYLVKFSDSFTYVPDHIIGSLGFKYINQTLLSELNDNESYSFEQIADYVEKNYSKIFSEKDKANN